MSLRMHERMNDLRRILAFELSASYRFPVTEGFLLILLFAASYGTLVSLYNPHFMNILPRIDETDLLMIVTRSAAANAANAFAYSLQYTAAFLVILVPMFVAFTFARTFEDGTLKSVLSYPVSRNMLFAVKALFLVTLYCFVTMTTSAAWVAVLLPVTIDIGEMSLLSIAFLLMVLLQVLTCCLLAVVSKRSSVTAVIGLLFFTGLTASQASPNPHWLVAAVANPVLLVETYYLGGEGAPALWQLTTAFALLSIVIIILILVGLRVFARTGVD